VIARVTSRNESGSRRCLTQTSAHDNARTYDRAMSWESGVQAVELRTGVSVTFTEQGGRGGCPVLLLHAWGESLRSFDRLVPLLPRSVHVLAMDQRGHGGAGKPPQGYDLESLGGDVEAFLDAVGVAAAVLVGSSSGGYVAQQVAVRSPERVAGLVLVGSPRDLHDRPEFADEIDRLRDPIDPGWARQFLAAFPLYTEVPRWYLEDRVADAVGVPAQQWQQSLSGLSSSPAPLGSGSIEAPSLLIWGDRDGFVDRRDQLALASAIPDARLLVYEGVGHLVLWERPERVAADVADFLGTLAC